MDWRLQGAQDERLRETLLFLGKFLLLSAPLYAILLFGNLSILQVMVASHSRILLEGLGFSVAQEGPLLTADGFTFLISPDSTGWKSLLFLAALILAVPRVAWKRRAAGLALGLLIVYAANLGRVVAIVLAEGSWGVEAAMLLHDYLWRFGLVAIVLGVWALWYARARGAGSGRAEPRARGRGAGRSSKRRGQ